MGVHLITWDHDKRLALHILRSQFELSWQDTNDVFLSLYTDIPATDVRGALQSQDSERKSRRSKRWQEFHKLPLTPGERARRDTSESLINERIATLRIGPSTPTNGRKLCQRNSRTRTRSNGSATRSAALPLSRQDPIAYLATPCNDQTSLRRTRCFSDESSDDEISVAPMRRPTQMRLDRIDRIDQSQVQVQIQVKRSSALATPPQTPPGKKVHRQISGKIINISRDKDPHAHLPPVSEEDAHPPNCQRILLFRWYDGDLHDSRDGFTARRFKGRLHLHQEPPSTLCWTDVFYHVDPSGKQIKYDGPLISATTQAWWVMRKGLKELHAGVVNGRIAVIDAGLLDPRTMHHALPYTRQLIKTHEFTEGAWRYGGVHEFFIWKEVPASAILSDFSVRELVATVNASPSMAETLRLNKLGATGRDFFGKVLPALKEDDIHLTPKVIADITELMHHIGLDAFSKVEHLAHMIENVIQGWGIQLTYRRPEQWVQLAARFARALGDVGGYILPSRDSRRLEQAFLTGVAWASSKSKTFKTRYARDSEALIRRKDKQARLIGVSDPAAMLSEEGSSTYTARRALQPYRYHHEPVDRSRIMAGDRPGGGCRAAAAGKRLREAIGLELEANQSDSLDEEDEIQYDH